MNKKGFTLIEIIVVVALIALIGIVVGTNMVGLNTRQKEKDYEKLALSFEEAATTYVGLDTNSIKTQLMVGNGTSKDIKLSDMVKSGHLNEDDINPITNEKFNMNDTVKVTYTKSTSKFTYCYNGSNWNCTDKEWKD